MSVHYVSLADAQKSGAAYLHVSGSQATDRTLRYRTKITLNQAGGPMRPVVPGKHMTMEEITARVEAEAKKRGVLFAVMDLPEIVLMSVRTSHHHA